MSEKNFLRPQQQEELKSEINATKAMLADKSGSMNNRAAAAQRVARMEKALDEQTPPPITKAQEDKLVKMERQLRDQMLEGMPSHEEMRRAPTGAIDKHRKWEARNKERLRQWKNIRLTLAQGSGDAQIANFERYRPHSSTLGMHSAITGKDASSFSFPSPQFQENYDEIDWSAHRDGVTARERRQAAEPDRTQEFLESLDLDAIEEAVAEVASAEEFPKKRGPGRPRKDEQAA